MTILMVLVAGMLIVLVTQQNRSSYVITEVTHIPQTRSSGCLWFVLWCLTIVVFSLITSR